MTLDRTTLPTEQTSKAAIARDAATIAYRAATRTGDYYLARDYAADAARLAGSRQITRDTDAAANAYHEAVVRDPAARAADDHYLARAIRELHANDQPTGMRPADAQRYAELIASRPAPEPETPAQEAYDRALIAYLRAWRRSYADTNAAAIADRAADRAAPYGKVATRRDAAHVIARRAREKEAAALDALRSARSDLALWSEADATQSQPELQQAAADDAADPSAIRARIDRYQRRLDEARAEHSAKPKLKTPRETIRHYETLIADAQHELIAASETQPDELTPAEAAQEGMTDAQNRDADRQRDGLGRPAPETPDHYEPDPPYTIDPDPDDAPSAEVAARRAWAAANDADATIRGARRAAEAAAAAWNERHSATNGARLQETRATLDVIDPSNATDAQQQANAIAGAAYDDARQLGADAATAYTRAYNAANEQIPTASPARAARAAQEAWTRRAYLSAHEAADRAASAAASAYNAYRDRPTEENARLNNAARAWYDAAKKHDADAADDYADAHAAAYGAELIADAATAADEIDPDELEAYADAQRDARDFDKGQAAYQRLKADDDAPEEETDDDDEPDDFGPPSLHETRLSVWQERDRLTISLIDKRDDRHIVGWIDGAAEEAIDDGILSHRAILGRLSETDARLHQSAYDYADATGLLDGSEDGPSYTADETDHRLSDDGLADYLQTAIETYDDDNDSDDDPPIIRRISSYAERGILTNDHGFVIATSDGAEFQITIRRSRNADR